MADQDPVELLGKLPEVVGIEDAVDVRIGFAHPLGDLRLTHHAAADEDLLPRVAALGVYQGADVAEHALLGVLADRAGVDDHEVRALGRVGQAVAAAPQNAADLLGVRLVLLAAVGLHVGDRGLALLFPKALQIIADFILTAQLLHRDQGRFTFQSSFLRRVSIPYPL